MAGKPMAAHFWGMKCDGYQIAAAEAALRTAVAVTKDGVWDFRTMRLAASDCRAKCYDLAYYLAGDPVPPAEEAALGILQESASSAPLPIGTASSPTRRALCAARFGPCAPSSYVGVWASPAAAWRLHDASWRGARQRAPSLLQRISKVNVGGSASR